MTNERRIITSKGVSEISRTIESLGDATRDSAQGVAQVKTSAEALTRMSSALGELVARYSLDEGHSA